MKNLRVMHLSTTLRGGAGIAARRTHEALRRASFDSHLFTLTGGDKQPENVESISRTNLKKIQSKIVTGVQQKVFQSSEKLITPISVNTASDALKNMESFDIIHLHSFYNLLSVSQIATIASRIYPKKFFITLHDQRLLTGGCHYSDTCSNFETVCRKCPQSTIFGQSFIRKSHRESTHTLYGLRNLNLISPSEWLLEKAQISAVTREIPCHLVRNPVPSCFYDSPTQSNASSVTNIGFVSANLNNKLKGISDFISAINQIREDFPELRFRLTFVGDGDVYGLKNTIEYQKLSLNSDEDMASILATVDLMIVPSLEDNLPSTMLEGLASGCHVVGSHTGGLTEILKGTGMETFQPSSHSEIVQALLSFLKNPHARKRNVFMNQFTYESVAQSLAGTYSAR